jgi:hypothetical protein
MRKILFILLATFAAGAAQAQIKCWTDVNGKRGCGDTPPPGAKVTVVRGTTAEPAPAAASKDAKKDAKKDGKDAKKGPMTAAEKEKDYRERQKEAEKAAAKADQEKKDLAAKAEGCERSKEYLRTLESGQRIARTNPSGERYYLEENQIAQEVAKARESMKQTCS